MSPASVVPGGAATITASVTSDAARIALVDIEVYGASGTKVHQQAFDQQSFAAGQTRNYPVVWIVPAGTAGGTYSVKIGVFGAGWGALAHWNDNAATFAITTSTATPTPTPTGTPAPTPSSSPPPGGNGSLSGLRVQGNQLVNSAGQRVQLLGVNRSGTEYACIQGWGFSDGPVDQPSLQAIAAWRGANVVRVPLNEHCWLARNGAPAAYSGAAYQQFLADYVTRLNSLGLIAMLELHWTGAGTAIATGQQPMLNRDHSVEFWRQVASHPTFKNNNLVIFDPHNEPYPDSNRDTGEAWRCWRDGGSCAGVPFQAAGMQEIITTIRGTGARNIIALGGVRYAGTLSQWLTYKPSDPQNNLIASWHIYSFSGCVTPDCWDTQSRIGPTTASAPVVAGEFGPDCGSTAFVQTVADYLDSKQGAGYLGWTWNLWGQCHDLITNYTGTPTPIWGQWLKNRFAARAGSASPTPTPTPTATPTPRPTVSPTATPTPTPRPTATPTTTPTPTATPRPTATPTPRPAWCDFYPSLCGATPTPTATPRPTATPTPTPKPTPTPTPTPAARFVTLPPGATLPSSQECASRVRRSSWEPRPQNAQANGTKPTSAQLAAVEPWTYSAAGVDDRSDAFRRRIDGAFTGTTDEIIQWGACKWGFDEDYVRAVAVQESWWVQATQGDYNASTGQYESFGLLQVRAPYHRVTFPASRDSTAFNVDYTLANRRVCYEGYVLWLNDVQPGAGYRAGDEWGCAGLWFAGRWKTPEANAYVQSVQGHLTRRTWAQPGF